MSGVQVVPEFVVFQSPPDPTATYHTFSLLWSMAISAILPDMNAGPILLNLKPSKAFSITLFSLLSWAIMCIEKTKDKRITNSLFVRFIIILFIVLSQLIYKKYKVSVFVI